MIVYVFPWKQIFLENVKVLKIPEKDGISCKKYMGQGIQEWTE